LPLTAIAERLAEVRDRIERTLTSSGRGPGEVTLIAVSKTFGPEAIEEVLDAGALDLGENRAQELAQKVAVLGSRPRWHFIGHLQSNKVRQVTGHAVLIHSVDRFGLAEAIARRARHLGVDQRILIEVNVSGEASKHGVEAPRLQALVEAIGRLEGVTIGGLMTMAPLSSSAEDSRPIYADLRALGDRLAEQHPQANELSMGMSGDFEVAIEEGATMIRVGRAIFGSRS
jgi:pyridoxal phosphate enzyme (YggS family)